MHGPSYISLPLPSAYLTSEPANLTLLENPLPFPAGKYTSQTVSQYPSYLLTHNLPPPTTLRMPSNTRTAGLSGLPQLPTTNHISASRLPNTLQKSQCGLTLLKSYNRFYMPAISNQWRTPQSRKSWSQLKRIIDCGPSITTMAFNK